MTITFTTILRSLLLFVLAGLAEIGGGYLVWQWLREGKAIWIGIVGGAVLILYGVIPTLQTESAFGRVYAAYGGIFIVLAILWGMAFDGWKPDRFDLIGAAVSDRAARNRIISTPSRKTMKKTKARIPQPWRFVPEAVSDSRRFSNCCLMPREVRHIHTTRLNTSTAAIARSVPSSTSFSGSKPVSMKVIAPQMLATAASPKPA